MNVKISFKHLEHTPALDEKIQAKSKRFSKYIDGNVDVHWLCYVEDGNHTAEIKLLGPQFEYHAKAYSETMYKTLDMVVSKVEKQLHKKKDKWKDHIHHKHDKILKEELVDELEKDEEKVIQDQYDEDVA